MVAITVAIAATVYVYVSGMIGTSPETTPNMQLVKDSTNKKLTVASADPGNLNWSSFEITIDGISGNVAGTNISANDSEDGPSQDVKAGDVIQLDDFTGSATVTIRHKSTNTLIGTWEFTN
ncbi:MAG: hypothetical protein KGY67_08480 [Candidatus Thermoplasmatota archaeon]|nr:hypothetical protein [Candidatus Thermoplasmatota archaeon]